MGGVYSIPTPPSSKYSADWLYEIEMRIMTRTTMLVQDKYRVRVSVLRDLNLNAYRVGIEIINPDWTLHGRLEEVVHDPNKFPDDIVRTQILMLAG